MGKKIRSARGEIVDFDLLKIKQQMASSPTTTTVKARQDFIEKRLRRKAQSLKYKLIKEQQRTNELSDAIVKNNSVSQEPKTKTTNRTSTRKQVARPTTNSES